MKQFIRLSILNKFLLLTISSVIALALILLTLSIGTQNYLMKRQLDEKISFITTNLEDKAVVLGNTISHQVEQALSTYSFFDIHTILNDELKQNADLNYAQLIGKNGKVYFNNLPKSIAVRRIHEIPKSVNYTEVRIKNATFLEYTFPLKISIESWGVLRLGFSLLPVDHAIAQYKYENSVKTRQLIFQTVGISAIVLLISILITAYLSKRITRPIIQLSENVHDFSENMTSFINSMEVNSGDEVGLLAQNFKEMANRIVESRLQLEEYSRTLEDQVKERTFELNEINDELNNFAYIVSHDLKSPLSSIKTLAEWLYQDHEGSLDDDGKERLSLLLGSVEQMKSLIDGILNYSKVGYKGDDKVDISLTELLDNTVALLSPPSHINIVYDADFPVLNIEKTRIQQVFLNIISNAIQYNDKKQGEIKIACKKAGKFWEISIHDNGPGISKKNQEKVFQVFKSFSTNSVSGNTGIGLSVVKKIIRMNGGKIWVNSSPNDGTTFYFTLPV